MINIITSLLLIGMLVMPITSMAEETPSERDLGTERDMTPAEKSAIPPVLLRDDTGKDVILQDGPPTPDRRITVPRPDGPPMMGGMRNGPPMTPDGHPMLDRRKVVPLPVSPEIETKPEEVK